MGGQTFIWGAGGGQEDGIAMKGAQSKVKWGANEGPWCEWWGGGHGPPRPPPPHSYATGVLPFRYSWYVI